MGVGAQAFPWGLKNRSHGTTSFYLQVAPAWGAEDVNFVALHARSTPKPSNPRHGKWYRNKEVNMDSRSQMHTEVVRRNIKDVDQLSRCHALRVQGATKPVWLMT